MALRYDKDGDHSAVRSNPERIISHFLKVQQLSIMDPSHPQSTEKKRKFVNLFFKILHLNFLKGPSPGRSKNVCGQKELARSRLIEQRQDLEFSTI